MTHTEVRPDVIFDKDGPWDWPVLVGAFIVQLVLPCVLPAYGIMVVDLVEEELMPLFSCIWAPALYIAAWTFSEPLCRSLVRRGAKGGKYVALTGVVLSSGGLISSSFVHHTLYSFFGFGVLGGAGACLVRARLDAVLQARFPRAPRAVDMALNVASALGQFLSPLYTHFLLQHYGLQGTPLMLAGVVMQAAVGSLLLDCGARRVPQPRPRTYTIRADAAIMDPSSSPLIPTTVSTHHRVSEDERFVSDLPLENVAGFITYRNAFGIDILPKIPEEGEDEEAHNDVKEKSKHTKRRSRDRAVVFSARCVDEYVVDNLGPGVLQVKTPLPRQVKRSGRGVPSLGCDSSGRLVAADAGERYVSDIFSRLRNQNETRMCEYVHVHKPSFRDREHLMDAEASRVQVGNGQTFPGSRMLFVDSNTVQDLSAIVDKGRGGWRCRCPCSCFAALREGLRTSYALPSLLLHTSVRLCPMGFAALAPIAVRTHISESTLDEAMLTVTISGFSWLCFLITMPWFLGMASHRQKFLYSMGSFAAAAGLYLFSESTSHDQIILNCVIIGIGQGASLATSKKVVLDALGDAAVSQFSCALDIATGFILLLAASIMGVFLGHEGGTTGCFVFLAVLQAASGLCWIVKPMIARFREHGHHDWSAGEFVHPG